MNVEQVVDLSIIEDQQRTRSFGARTFDDHRAQSVSTTLRDDENDLGFLGIRGDLHAAVNAHIDKSSVFVVLVEGSNIVNQDIFIELALGEQRHRLAGVDLTAEFLARQRVVADELDFLHLDARSLDHAKNQDPRVLQARFIDGDLSEVMAALLVEILDARDRLLKQKVVAGAAGIKRNRLAKLLVGDELVAHHLQILHDRLLEECVGEFDGAISQHGRGRLDGSELAESIERRHIVANGLGIEGLPRGHADIVQDLAFLHSVEPLEEERGDRAVGEGLVVDGSRLRERGGADGQRDHCGSESERHRAAVAVAGWRGETSGQHWGAG